MPYTMFRSVDKLWAGGRRLVSLVSQPDYMVPSVSLGIDGLGLTAGP